MQRMSVKDKRIEIRLDDATDQELKRLAKMKKISKSQVIRELILQADTTGLNMVPIRQALESNNATRITLASVTANINQLAKAYNMGKIDPEKVREHDRHYRSELMGLLKDQLRFSKEMHAMCLEILGRK